jgi:hypothetical protein
MKKLLGLDVAVMAFALATSMAYGHPGAIGSSGCHTDKSTNDYHCHRARAYTENPPPVIPDDETLKAKAAEDPFYLFTLMPDNFRGEGDWDHGALSPLFADLYKRAYDIDPEKDLGIYVGTLPPSDQIPKKYPLPGNLRNQHQQ